MPVIFESNSDELQSELKKYIEEALICLHIPYRLDGFAYLEQAILQTAENPERIRYITKELYPDIAKTYQTTVSCVERSIRTAIQRCWNGIGRETLDEMVGYHLIERPTNSEFIALIAAYIRHRA